MNATFASSSPSGAFESISTHFHVSLEAAGLTITLFLLGYVAGPLIFAPLSEFYGRRWIFYITFSLYLAFNFLCAFAPNFGSLLVGRFLTGTLVSAPLSNAPGVLADLWNPLERGNAMASFSAIVYVGPALGPVIAGFLELKKDWRWSFYVLLWLGGLTALIMLTIPETHAPTVLLNKARRIRRAKLAGHENVKAPVEDENRSLAAIYKVALTRPWIILFDPISFLVAVYMSVVYTLLYMLFSIYPIVFQEKRGWNSGVGELPLVGTVVGAVLGGCIVFYDTHRRAKKVKSGEVKLEDFEPEDRLPLAMIGGIGFPITMFWFAWSAEYK
jgi:MFS transporter, DHA1 family, multidrug resistance protein